MCVGEFPFSHQPQGLAWFLGFQTVSLCKGGPLYVRVQVPGQRGSEGSVE